MVRSESVVRQQYLIPERLVQKLRALSKRHGVPATEIVRRALDDYTGEVSDARGEAATVDHLLSDALAMIEQVTATLAELNRKLDNTQQRIDSGAIRQQAHAEMRQWLDANPEAARQFQRFLTARS